MELYPDIYGDMPMTEAAAASFAWTIMVLYLTSIAVTMLISYGLYFMQSLGFYTVAHRRGIRHPWLAWVPFGVNWIIGSIADQSLYITKGKIRNYRKILLSLQIVLVALSVAVFAFAMYVLRSVMLTSVSGQNPEQLLPGLAAGLVVIYLAILAVTVVNAVFLYISLYHSYRSCSPRAAVAFLVLSIFFNFLIPIFIFAIRKKDNGMPPRRSQPSAPIYQAPMHCQPVPQQPPVYRHLPEE